ncbi:hypothetical protein [Enterocloster clostridioformis]|uniref:hypothetical protein n=1 Tax=Enterocloster clostridioformis TaxID=1531 RepID=UPI00321933C7
MKTPKWIIEFKIDLYALKEYKGWTDEDLGKQLGVTSRTVMNMRKNPCSVNGGLILRVQDMLKDAEEKY